MQYGASMSATFTAPAVMMPTQHLMLDVISVNCTDPLMRPTMRHYPKLLSAAVIATLILVAVTAAAIAGPFEDAKAAYDKDDYPTALRLFRSLAEQGDLAQQRLGLMYERGLSVPQDYAEAARWYRRAADQGFASAQWTLSSMYATGSGVPKDYVQAHMWCNVSAAQGFEPATYCRADLERAMTPEQVAEAQKLARDWKPKPER
jgi:uncharacterized protein